MPRDLRENWAKACTAPTRQARRPVHRPHPRTWLVVLATAGMIVSLLVAFDAAFGQECADADIRGHCIVNSPDLPPSVPGGIPRGLAAVGGPHRPRMG